MRTGPGGAVDPVPHLTLICGARWTVDETAATDERIRGRGD